MKNNLIRMLALALCFCAILSFAACGEETPAKDDDITPPANDTPTPDEPTADEPSEPSDTPDEPTQPDVPVEPTEPAEPDDPNEFNKQDTNIDPIWNPENYTTIVDGDHYNPPLIALLTDNRVAFTLYFSKEPIILSFDEDVIQVVYGYYYHYILTSDGNLYALCIDLPNGITPELFMTDVEEIIFSMYERHYVRKYNGDVWMWEEDYTPPPDDHAILTEPVKSKSSNLGKNDLKDENFEKRKEFITANFNDCIYVCVSDRYLYINDQHQLIEVIEPFKVTYIETVFETKIIASNVVFAVGNAYLTADGKLWQDGELIIENVKMP